LASAPASAPPRGPPGSLGRVSEAGQRPRARSPVVERLAHGVEGRRRQLQHVHEGECVRGRGSLPFSAGSAGEQACVRVRHVLQREHAGGHWRREGLRRARRARRGGRTHARWTAPPPRALRAAPPPPRLRRPPAPAGAAWRPPADSTPPPQTRRALQPHPPFSCRQRAESGIIHYFFFLLLGGAVCNAISRCGISRALSSLQRLAGAFSPACA